MKGQAVNAIQLSPPPHVGRDAAAEHKARRVSRIRRRDMERQRMKKKDIARRTCALDDL
jgi:hypothetical protein